MLNKKYRITSDKFRRIWKTAKSYQGFFLSLKLLINNETKIAIVVGKSISKLATDRNKIKRMISAELEKYLPKFSNCNYMVIIAKKSIKDAKQKQVSDELEKMFKMARVI